MCFICYTFIEQGENKKSEASSTDMEKKIAILENPKTALDRDSTLITITCRNII
jgi:hypothetical protein